MKRLLSTIVALVAVVTSGALSAYSVSAEFTPEVVHHINAELQKSYGHLCEDDAPWVTYKRNPFHAFRLRRKAYCVKSESDAIRTINNWSHRPRFAGVSPDKEDEYIRAFDEYMETEVYSEQGAQLRFDMIKRWEGPDPSDFEIVEPALR